MKRLLKDKLKDYILDYIREHRLNVGDRLISEKSFAQLFEVNHLTVRKALSMLVEEGYVEKRPRSGAYVKQLPAQKANYAKGTNNLVAVLMDPKGHFFSNLYSSLCKQLEANGFIPINFSASTIAETNDASKAMDHIKSVNCRRLIAVQEAALFSPEVSSQLNLQIDQSPYWESVTWVHGDSELPQQIFYSDCLLNDSTANLSMAISHLVEQGHQRIALMTNEWDQHVPFYNYKTVHIKDYCSLMTAFGISDWINVLETPFNESSIISAVEGALSQPNPPTAFVTSIDYRAVCTLKAIQRLGLRVPEDVALVGNINTHWAYEFDLTSVDHNYPLIAELAISSLTETKVTKRAKRIIHIPPKLVIRGSSSPTYSLNRMLKEGVPDYV